MTEKISACILSRDDGATLEPLLQTLRPHVDELIVVDTGSTDDSVAIAQRYADKAVTFTGCNGPDGLIQDFSAARNHALELASHPFHFWCDADDELIGAENLRLLASQRKADNQYWLIPYDYSFDAEGRCTCVHWRENLAYPRDVYRWKTPVHEVLLATQVTGTLHQERTTLVRRIHRRSLSRRAPDPERNLRILKRYVQLVGESDVRALYYLGVEYATRNDVGNAIRVLRRYVTLSGWTDEKCLAQLELARIYHAINDQEMAVEWAQKANATKSWDAPYWVMARAFYAMAIQGIDADYNIRRAAHFAELGFKLPEADTVLFINPMERWESYRLLTHALSIIGNVPGALEAANKGLSHLPGDPWLLEAKDRLETAKTQTDVLAGLQKLFDAGKLEGAFVDHLSQALSRAGARNNALSLPPVAPTVPPAGPPPEQTKAHDGLDVVFFIGPQYEPWSPETLVRTGMGGSETMAWEMAKRLRLLGHRVRVYGHCNPEHEGLYEGVEWLAWERFRGVECDVLVSSRRPDAANAEGLKARLRLLWCHDVHFGDMLTPARALRWHRIIALSNWHKRILLNTYSAGQPALIARLQPEDVVVTRNGIDPEQFTVGVVRNPKRVVYSSSPDRGLYTLLTMWPTIRSAVPDAELHIYYGFENWEKSVAAGVRTDHPWLSAEMLAEIKRTIATTPGVTMHGRVSPSALAVEFMSSGVWAYPTWFSETSCITAMQAQAAGLYCIATPVAALNETVGHVGELIEGQWEVGPGQLDPKTGQAFIDATVYALLEQNQPYSRDEIREQALTRLGLAQLSLEWDVMFRQLLAEADEKVVPSFRGVA